MIPKTILHCVFAIGMTLASTAFCDDAKKVEAKAEPPNFLSLMSSLYDSSRKEVEKEEAKIRKETRSKIPYLYNWEDGRYSGLHRIVPLYSSIYDRRFGYSDTMVYPLLSSWSSSDSGSTFLLWPLLSGGADANDKDAAEGYAYFCLPLLSISADLKSNDTQAACQMLAGCGYITGKVPIEGMASDALHSDKADASLLVLLPAMTAAGTVNGRFQFSSLPLLTSYGSVAAPDGFEETQLVLLPLLTWWDKERNDANKLNRSKFVALGGLYGRDENDSEVENWSLWGLLFTNKANRFDMLGGLLYSDKSDAQFKTRTVSTTPLFRYITKDDKSVLSVFRLFEIPMW